MRTRASAHSFFIMGRVFSMLWTETASATMQVARSGTENTAITVGRFGQGVYSQIRRFVVMKVNRDRHFVYAWSVNDLTALSYVANAGSAISTYGKQGTLKSGCAAGEHTIVHLTGSQPIYLYGEYERGMTKDPIEIEPTHSSETMEPTSRLRFGKMYSIEWNVKVKDIGLVSRRHMSKLMRYHKQEEENGFDNDVEYSSEEEDSRPIPAQPNYMQSSSGLSSNIYQQT